MNNSEKTAFRKAFSRIYLEENAINYPRTESILSHFPDAQIIPVADYKHVFNRPHQNTLLQKQAPSLILAVGKPPYLYPGAAVCQSFGEEHFYYTGCVMNCPYDCEYCYLQGMYPSGDVVVFVNPEDFFRETENVLAEHPLYLCISFDTDLLALEPVLGYVRAWSEFAAAHPTLTLEVRTKSAAVSSLSALPVLPNVILAVTMSPDEVIRRYEHRTPSLSERIRLADAALAEGRPVRLCFDPMLMIPDYENAYRNMFRRIFETIPASRIRDVSVGSFRISADYMKRMRRNRPCEITLYPYELTDGVYHYDNSRLQAMLALARSELAGIIPDEKIFYWEDNR